VGTEVLVNAGKLEAVRDGGDAPGTQIEVRSLFYNLPARRKFLRTEATEASHVEHQLHLLALGHPSISFVHLVDDRVALQLAPAPTLLDRIRDLSGAELASELLEVPPTEENGIKISGYVGRAGVSRSSRQQQLCFLNGRAVENITLSQGLREGYHTALMKGQHPVTFLFIEMDPGAVDVNVHPAKREVRFRTPSEVRDTVIKAVRAALEGDRARWSGEFRAAPLESPLRQQPTEQEVPHPDLPLPAPEPRPTLQIPPPPRSTLLATPTSSAATSGFSTSAPEVVPAAPRLPSELPREEEAEPAPAPVPETFRFLGVLGKLFVLMENASGLVLVDQHAAHERILFEEMQRRMETQGVPSQRLLLPLTLRLAPKDGDWVERNLELLDRAGISLESFGAGTFKVDALPTFLKAEDPVQLLHDIIDDLRETNAQGARLRMGQDMIAKTVCRHAVKANDTLREPELVKLVEDLLRCDLPYCCPHGRPTMIQLSYLELEKKFGRKA